MKPQASWLEWLRSHKKVTVLLPLGFSGLIWLGHFTDALSKIAAFADRLMETQRFSSALGQNRSATSIALYDIQRTNAYGDDCLFTFRVQNLGDADAALPSVGQIEMLEPEKKSYTLLRISPDHETSPMIIQAKTMQLYVDYLEDNHHIAAQLRLKRPVRISIRLPHIDSSGKEHYAEFDTLLVPEPQ